MLRCFFVYTFFSFIFFIPNAKGQHKLNLNAYFKMEFPVQNYYKSVTEMAFAEAISTINPQLGASVDTLVKSKKFNKEYSDILLSALKGPKDSLKSMHPEDIIVQMIDTQYPACIPIFANPNRAMGQAVAKIEMRSIIIDAPNGFINLRAFKRELNVWSLPFFASPLGSAPYMEYDTLKNIATVYCVPDIDGMTRDNIDSLYSRIRSLFKSSLVGWHGGILIEDDPGPKFYGIDRDFKISFTEGTIVGVTIANHDASSPTYLTIEIVSPKLSPIK